MRLSLPQLKFRRGWECGQYVDRYMTTSPSEEELMNLKEGNFLSGSPICRYSLSSLRTINITHIHYIVLGHCGPEPCFLEARNSARASFASVRLDRGSQVFSSCPYPSHLTRYNCFLRRLTVSRMASTSYEAGSV